MNETKTTLTYLGVAAFLILVVFLTAPGKITPDDFLDQNEPFFPRLHRSQCCHDPGGNRLRPRNGHGSSIQGDVRARQVDHPFAQQFPGGREGPARENSGRSH